VGFVFRGDHGFKLGEKDRWSKAVLREEANRTVMMMAGSGIPAGSEIDPPVSLLDIYLTMIAQVGLTPKPELEGLSLVPLIADPSSGYWDIPVVSNLRGQHLSFRSQRWRLMEHSSGSQELYDHDADPNEWDNLAEDPQYDDVKAWLVPEPSIGIGLGFGVLAIYGLWASMRKSELSA